MMANSSIHALRRSRCHAVFGGGAVELGVGELGVGEFRVGELGVGEWRVGEWRS